MAKKKDGRTQCDRVYDYIREFGSITPLQAMNDLGCYRLSARIKDLRDLGINIQSEMIPRINRYRETIHVARYSIKKNEKQMEMF